jgi:chromate reductase
MIMGKDIKIVGFTGSLRRKSFNRAALQAAQELLPAGASLEILDLAAIPFFNEDLEAEGVPEVVASFKQKIAKADALLIATPEYNYSIPPVLKNALDWASRGTGSPLSGKPTAIMSASPGMFGGARAQYHLRQVCVILNLEPLNRPEVFIMGAHTKFDQDGKLTDDYTRQAITKLLEALVQKVAFSRKLEIDTIKKMITLYCHGQHGRSDKELCPECRKLFIYTEQRLDKCVYGDNKPVCSKCPIHCYKSAMRTRVKEVMRYAGPRIMWHSPILTARYMYRKRFKSTL